MWKEFKAFILRGNVIDLAVALVIGAAFTGVVTAFTDGILMNIVAAIFGKPNFDALVFHLGNGTIEYGKFLTAVVNFVLIGAALFAVVKGMNALRARGRRTEEAPAETDHDLLAQIRDALVDHDRLHA